MTGPVNTPDLTDETLEAWITAAAFEYDVPEDGADRVLAAAEAPGRSSEALPARRGSGSLPAGVRRLPSVRVPHPRLVAASVLIIASLAAANLGGSTGSTNITQNATSAPAGAVPAKPGDVAHGTAGQPQRALDNSQKAVVTGGAASSGSSSGASPGRAYNVPAPAPTAFTANGGTPGLRGDLRTTSTIGAAADSAKIVHTGTLTLTVAKGQVTDTLTKLDSLAAGAQGYVASTKTTESGDLPSGTVVLRVPADSYDSVLAQARKLGTVDSQTSSGKDVTAESADLQAKMTSLKRVRENYLALLAKAKTIGETLSVQQHVDDNQAQIDQLQGQINVLADQASYGTLTVTVTQKVPTPLAKPTHHKGGLAIAWDRAVTGFVTGVEALIARSGRAALVLLLLAGGVIVLRLGWRVGRRRLV